MPSTETYKHTRVSPVPLPFFKVKLRLITLFAIPAISAVPVGKFVLGATVQDQLAPCAACHGANGASLLPETPSLGGQPAFYLSIQLLMYRERMRLHEPKNSLLNGISDNDLQRLAEALSKLPAPPSHPEPADAERSTNAQALVAQHRCNFCHNQDFSGEKNAPRLAGQREDYLVKALREYKDNSRRAYDTSMADVMSALSDSDIRDLAHYLARLR